MPGTLRRRRGTAIFLNGESAALAAAHRNAEYYP